jgi:hypothetical protein
VGLSTVTGAGRRPRREMDVAALRDRIRATLDTNQDTRRQAEAELKYVRQWPRTRPFSV